MGAASLGDQFRQQLEGQGWETYRAADGSSIYRLPSAERKRRPALAADIEQQLSAQGWQAYRSDDGSVIYRRPAPRLANFARRFARLLENHGWQPSRGADGSVIYTRLRQSDGPQRHTQPHSDGAPRGKQDLPVAQVPGASQSSPAAQIERQLTAHGWHRRLLPDRSLLFSRS
jgi:predicted RNA binding protein YcfA (HicA-like mRNA interferase family)